MKCIKCKTVNVHNANYCKKCANQFSEKEQEAAEKWTFIGIVKRLENFKEKITFGWLFDHWAFKVGSIIGVLLIGVCCLLFNGNEFMIQESKQYIIKYNQKENEYYLYSKEDKTELSLYIPNKVENIVVNHYDSDGNAILGEEYTIKDNIVLYSNGVDDYYILEAKYSNDKSEKIKLFIYHEEDGE